MQTTTTWGTGRLGRVGADALESNHGFAALFVLAGSKGVESEVLRRRLKLTESDFRYLTDDLQRGYLVDVVSHLQGGSVVETLSLTDEGASTLQKMMERMCELPEIE
jgi:hypothetical protein